jgi:hypothetical protein
MLPSRLSPLVHLMSILLSTFVSIGPQQGIHTMLNAMLNGASTCPPGLSTPSVHLPCPPLTARELEPTVTTLRFETDPTVC